jgi:hypothetical protein
MVRIAILLCIVVGCDQPFSACPAFEADTDAGTFPIYIDVPVDQVLPVASDLVVRGSVRPVQVGVVITKVLVNGIAANPDGPDFSTFDATVPLAVLQGEASTSQQPQMAQVKVEVVTSCSDAPIEVKSFMVTLRTLTSLTLSLDLAGERHHGGDDKAPARRR